MQGKTSTKKDMLIVFAMRYTIMARVVFVYTKRTADTITKRHDMEAKSLCGKINKNIFYNMVINNLKFKIYFFDSS